MKTNGENPPVMMNNDVLRSVRYMLNINNDHLLKTLALVEMTVPPQQLASYVKKEGEEGYQPCPDIVMSYFLNGLVLQKRGKDENQPTPQFERKITNNIILKKLRIAFALKTDDIQAILLSQNFRISIPEVTAMMRSPDHKNYRACGDQVLRYFLKGLTVRMKKSS